MILYNNKMVLYICDKCNKKFTRKQSFQAHVNRKYSCILTEDLNINLELEKNNKNYEEKNKQYEEIIKKLEEENKKIKKENFIMKIQVKEKQELLNNKDIIIKDLYINMNVKTKKKK